MVKNPLSLTGLPLIRALLFDNFPGRTFVWPHAAARIPRPPRKKDTTAGGGGRTTGALWSEGVTSTQPFGKDVRNVPGTKTLCFRSFPLGRDGLPRLRYGSTERQGPRGYVRRIKID